MILIDIIRRVFVGSEIVSLLMIIVDEISLIANVYCLRLIDKYKVAELHMRAS